MKKKFRLRLLGVCFVALLTIFAAFSTPALADDSEQGGARPNIPMPAQPPPQLPPEILALLFIIF